MIQSPEEFKYLRLSENNDEQYQASNEMASVEVWTGVISKFPELREWVAHNKKIQIEVLEKLALDINPDVRCVVARKRKINQKIFQILKNDPNEDVRYALLSNTKMPIEMKRKIKVDDSMWLQEVLKEIETKSNDG